jgi:hypothetical protein
VIEPVEPGTALLARALLGVAACLWLAAVQLAPTTRGVGAALSGHRLADLIGSGSVGGAVPRVIGPLWYAMPVGAAVVLVTLGMAGTVARAVRLACSLLASASALGFVVFLADTRGASLGPGAWCAVAGALLALVATAIEVPALLGRGRVESVL